MPDVQVIRADGELEVRVPGNALFDVEAASLGAQTFDDTDSWFFHIVDETRVRALCRRFYGTDGSDEARVMVRLQLHHHARYWQQARAAGVLLVSRDKPDEGVRFAPDVSLVAGEFPRTAGTQIAPQLGNQSPVLLEVRNVPAGMAQKMVAEDEAVVVTAVDRLAVLRSELTAIEARRRAIRSEVRSIEELEAWEKHKPAGSQAD
ncbi:hypothetical protein [Nocardia sp. NPDC050435]|uniref:hypothetical protein n=1 Tax=Nocardia sp. NPDC050435 TaxID=3155040 RepID=UPI0033C7CC40